MASFDQWFRQFTEIVPSSYNFDIVDVLTSLGLSFLLSAIIGKTYSLTHRGVSYSQSYVHTIVIVTMVVSSVMLIVGSNIARAFTLLGALSIVRFRNAVKETRDVGFIFFAMAVGMACGTRFYPMAIVMTALICAVIALLTYFEFGSRLSNQSYLRIVFPRGKDFKSEVHPLLKKHARSYSLINFESLSDEYNELNYAVVTSRRTNETELIEDLKKTNQGQAVSMTRGDATVEI